MKLFFSILLRLLFILIGAISMFVFMVSMDSGKYQTFEYGFAVDSYDNVYVGNPKYIYVHSSDGKVTNTIPVHTSRGYHFTVKDDLLYLTDSQKVYIMELSGSIVTVLDYSFESFPFLYNLDYDSFVGPGMTEYSMKSILGRKMIVRSDEGINEVILKMPLQSYYIMLFVGFSCTLAMISIFSFIYQVKFNKL